MSKISLTPNASGTGTFTIASPDSNTNRTLTLPDADGALLAGAQAAFIPATVSGATQALDVSAANFFDAGTLTADTTVSFTNVPTEARWTYTAEAASLTSYDLTAVSYVTKYSVSSEEPSPRGIFFKPDGTVMYVLGGLGDAVYEYSLSTAWDVSSSSYVGNFSVSVQDSNPQYLFFKPDGTVMYVVGSTNDAVFEYSLSTAWDISTSSYVRNFSVSAQDINPRGIYFKPDGTSMYIVGLTGQDVNEYSLSTAWNISTASYVRNFNVSAQDTVPIGLFFKPDGTVMYVVGGLGDAVNEYNLSTAWNVSTASYVRNFNVSAQETSPKGLFFKADGRKMYICGDSVGDITEYISEATTTISLPASIQNPPLAEILTDSQVSYTFYTLDGGTNVYLINEEVL